MAKTYDDIDLMQYFDGELEPELASEVEEMLAQALSRALAGAADRPAAEADAGPDAREHGGDGLVPDRSRAVLDSLAQVRDLVRGRLELAADDAEGALDAMWSRIERRIQANGSAPADDAADIAGEEVIREPARRGARASAAAGRRASAHDRPDLPDLAELADGHAARAAVAPPAGGSWQRLAAWFDAHRAHFMTGAVTAGAVAALFLWLRPDPPQPRPVEPVAVVPSAPVTVKEAKVGQPRIESLDVPEGSGTVFTIPGEAEDDSGATVILVTFDEDAVEGPI